MKEVKREVTKEEIMYEITKEELSRLKKEERRKGRYDILGYLCFSIKYYQYELNIAGMKCLVEDIFKFVTDQTNTIRNWHGYSFDDYVREYC